MTLGGKLQSTILGLMFSPRVVKIRRGLRELRRKASAQPHVVAVFLQLDDPYSYILSHYLPSLAAQYDIDLRMYLSEALGGPYQPAPDMLPEYAATDCTRLASELGIPFLDKGHLPPTEHRVGMSNALAVLHGTPAFNDELRLALAVYWRGDTAKAAAMSSADPAAKALLGKSQKLLRKLGHYNSAMLHHSGEWFWGVDRLHYLMDRLDDLGAARKATPDPLLKSITQAMKVSLPVKPPAATGKLPPIEFFHSLGSPYSYLALKRTFEIADAFGLKVKLRPVLPMVMRGMAVPRNKLLYIAGDASREARRRNNAFGKVARPDATGVERCLAVFRYAESEHRERDFLLNAGVAIWAEAIDVASDKGMRKVTGRTGLFWPDVEKVMQSDDWRESIEANRESMMNSGSWGVPTIRMGDFVIWGQDRDWLLVRHIEEACDSGDGILV